MCGIVGYVGRRQAQDVLLSGLEKLEYRGYDSAGVAIFEDGEVRVEKSVGRLAVLGDALIAHPVRGNQGIGHTRWATHGRPSNENAHPHADCSRAFVVVHNGIIENYQTLRDQLLESGHSFASETDTEIVAHLLEEAWTGELFSTVLAVLPNLRGAYALAIMAKDEPGTLIAVRKQSPLVIGLGDGEQFLASDIPALLEYTRDVYILGDGELAVLQSDRVLCYDLAGNPIGKEIFKVTWDAVAAEKGGYEHFMLKEIHEQPKAVRDTLSGRIAEDGSAVTLGELDLSEEVVRSIDRIHIVACGTSYHAGLVGKVAIETLARIPVDVEIASEYRYRNPIVTDRTLILVISQSGETADTLAALRNAKMAGNRVMAITNVVGSSAAREADHVLVTWAGPEISVASTKAYTTQLIALYLFAAYLGQIKGTIASDERAKLMNAILELPLKIDEVLKTAPAIETIARDFSSWDDAFFSRAGA